MGRVNKENDFQSPKWRRRFSDEAIVTKVEKVRKGIRRFELREQFFKFYSIFN